MEEKQNKVGRRVLRTEFSFLIRVEIHGLSLEFLLIRSERVFREKKNEHCSHPNDYLLLLLEKSCFGYFYLEKSFIFRPQFPQERRGIVSALLRLQLYTT